MKGDTTSEVDQYTGNTFLRKISAAIFVFGLRT